MANKCEKCSHTATSRYDTIQYNESLDMYICGSCEIAFEDGIEEYETQRRNKIAEDNEY